MILFLVAARAKKREEVVYQQEEVIEPVMEQESKTRTKVKVGDYLRILVWPKNEFLTFRIEDAGKNGRSQLLLGKRADESWDIHVVNVNKEDAHREKGKIVAHNKETEELLMNLPSSPTHLRGDVFYSRPQTRSRPARVRQKSSSRKKRHGHRKRR